MWTVVSIAFAYGAYCVNLPAFLDFVQLAIDYLLSAIVNIAEPTSIIVLNIAGWVGIVDGLCAWWLGFGLVLNTMSPRPRIPIIPYPYSSR